MWIARDSAFASGSGTGDAERRLFAPHVLRFGAEELALGADADAEATALDDATRTGATEEGTGFTTGVGEDDGATAGGVGLAFAEEGTATELGAGLGSALGEATGVDVGLGAGLLEAGSPEPEVESCVASEQKLIRRSTLLVSHWT